MSQKTKQPRKLEPMIDTAAQRDLRIKKWVLVWGRNDRENETDERRIVCQARDQGA